jgi:hypothetical protein
VRAKRRVTIELELDEFHANLIAADLMYLLAHTKDLPAVVKTTEAPFAIESRDRLEEFTNQLREVLHGTTSPSGTPPTTT